MPSRAHNLTAAEEALVRRIAALAARSGSPAEVFDAVTEEAGRLLDVASTGVLRFESDDTVTLVAVWGPFREAVPAGTRLPVGAMDMASEIARTARPVCYDRDLATGALGEHARRLGVVASAGDPIVVEGRLWGALMVASADGGSLPPDIENRLAQFTELAATAIADAEARAELAQLADEQAALRRVATLAAEESPVAELLAKVAEEVAGRLGPGVDSAILRYGDGATATVVAVWGDQPPSGIRVGARLPVDGTGVTALVFREQRPVRVDDYWTATGAIADHARVHGIRSSLGCPIVVGGAMWGAMVVALYGDEPFRIDTEHRIEQFTELVATAIANSAARAEIQRLAEEQAALRRVATLVAQGAAAQLVFEAVVVEMARLLGASQVGLVRAENSREITLVANRGQPAPVRTGMRLSLAGDSVVARVLRTGRAVQLDRISERDGSIVALARLGNIDVTLGTPIVIDGAVWGVMAASWEKNNAPAADAQQRLTEFAELVGTAIANADSRDQLNASRTRVLTAADEARRRVARDLHDGAQQRLVHTIVTLKLAQRALGDDRERTRSLMAEALAHAEAGHADLVELGHGILPTLLTHGGLLAGVESLVARLDLPVDIEVTADRLAPDIEASAYFIVAEALTNVVKHSRTATATVTATVDAGRLRLAIRDHGIGGADPRGHGLLGLSDRVAALGGSLSIDSRPGSGTVVVADLPVPA